MIRNILLMLLIPSLVFGAAFQFGGIKHDVTSVTSAAGTTTLTNASTQVQIVTGTTTQTIKLPDATTLRAGYWYMVKNQSTGIVTVVNDSSTSLTTLLSAQTALIYLTSAASAAGGWSVNKISPSPLNTKGQLTVTDGSTLAALAPGTDNYVLTYDSVQTYGIKWAANSGSVNKSVVFANISAPSGGSCAVTVEGSLNASDDWINGTPSSASTSRCLVTYQAGFFAGTPACVCAAISTGLRACAIRAISSTTVETWVGETGGGTLTDEPISLICMGAP